jgi:hypothetical protein
MLNLNYDRQHDILYARKPYSGPVYGEEDNNGVITYFNMESDAVTGMAIYNFKQRVENGQLDAEDLPIEINFFHPDLRNIVFENNTAFKCVIS